MAGEIQVAKPEGGAVAQRGPESGPVFAPQVDIIEKPEQVTLVADMPGVKKENIKVTLDQGMLTIDASSEPAGEPGLNLQLGEYEVGRFHRCFGNLRGLDMARAEATLANGVLRLVIPRSEQHEPRQIEVKGL